MIIKRTRIGGKQKPHTIECALNQTGEQWND